MSLNPILTLDHVIDEYRDYLRSEFRARDRSLRLALEAELDRPLFLAQEPFYQAHRPFRAGEPWSRLPLDPALARAMAVRSRSETAYLHQSEAIIHLHGPAASPLVVTTGTGSGKTECFLLPVIQNAIADAHQFRRTGLTAILVYPMNALANDQEKRIKEYLEAAGVADLVDVRKYDRGTNQAERERMRNNPPRILLTNYMMLEYLLIRPKDRDDLFANHRCRFLVMDEVHTYRGVLGSNIALLLRRLRAHLARARQDWSPDVPADQHAARYPTLLNVGTSATIKSIADSNLSAGERNQHRDAAVQEFFSRLTGVQPATIRVVGEVLEDIIIPAESRFAPAVPAASPVNVTNLASVERALSASSGVAPTGDLARAARHCRLLWLLNQWLVSRPMSLNQIVDLMLSEIPERRGADRAALRREVEAVLLAGSALPEDAPGGLRLRAHRLIRGGWKFVRCLDRGCGRIYPMGQPVCDCGRQTAPLFLCRNCGADYLRLSGDPVAGQMQPYSADSADEEWMIYDVARQEMDIQPEEDPEEEDGEPRVPRRGTRARIAQVRGHPVHSGSFDPHTLNFSLTASDFPFQVRLVHGRSRCLCCGGTAGTRNVITPVALGTSAAVKVLGEGLVEALADANADREGHDGKERLLIFSDSRQDAAHQARFIIFASRYDRMRRRLFQILQSNPRLSLQRAVELLGDLGVQAGDNPNGPDDPERRLTEDERLRVRAWEEAPLLDEIAVTPFFRGTLINLGVLSIAYDGLEEEVRSRGGDLCAHWGITQAQLTHLCRCFLDELRVRSMLSREMMRYHPRNPACPDYIARADWERKVAQPKGMPVDPQGRPLPYADNAGAPFGITIRNAWRAPGTGGRAPSFQRLVEHLLHRFGAPQPDANDGLALLQFLQRGSFTTTSDVQGHRQSARVCQLNAEVLRLRLFTGADRLRCNICSWPLAGAYAGAPCPRCHGVASLWPDAEVEQHRTVRRMRQPTFRPLIADEHTAQVTNERRVDLENRFKASAAEAPLNVLACSPTMEMGIDVGGLDAVMLRNVPPRPDNYAQRGGRAGRRTRVGLVVGYARSNPHDQYFFDHPEEMISGEIPAPAISLGNRDVILRHLAAIAFGAANPGLAGRMVEYVSEQGEIKSEPVNALIAAVQAQGDYALQLARLAWGEDILRACGLDDAALQAHLASLPNRINDVVQRTARQVQELRAALERFYATLQGRQSGVRAADLVARLLGVPVARRDDRPEADDASAGYPPRRFAEFGILPGYEFPSEPASLRLLGDPNEENLVSVARRFGIYQYMPAAPVYARARRWKVIGLDTSSPWNPRSDTPWNYRLCRRCGLRYAADHARCPRCQLAEPGPAYPAFEYGGFVAQRNEAPVLDEEDRIGARNLVAFFPQWNGEVFERWSVGPGWQLQLSRNEEVRWLNEGLEPTEAERERGLVLHQNARGFCLCSTCGHTLIAPPPEDAGPRRRARTGNAIDPYGHSQSCARAGQPAQPSGIVTSLEAEVLRLVAFIPEGFDANALEEWTHSLGAALRIGIRHHLLLDGSEIEFEPEGPWQESAEAGAFQRVSLTFVDPSVGGSGYIARMAREFHLIAQRALEHLNHPNCETACYRCLKSYQNQRYHDQLRWPAIIGDLDQLAASAPQPLPLERGDSNDPRPWLEAFAAGVGSPLELRFLRLFEQHGFHPERQVSVAPAEGLPPISIADFAVSARRLAIYVDGAAFHTGARLRRDRIIRNRLREGPLHWNVVELRAADLARGADLVRELMNR
ncbi:MAG: DEAD/DEAH box helicase [Verrucomicrobiota bacterium]